jgi:hypothetical protein
MTPHKQKGGKNWRLDRTFLGVGRIARASGTTHPQTFKRINVMLSGLYSTGQLDVLAMIRDGIHAPLVVLRFYERGQIDKLPSAETTVSLVPALKKFQALHEGVKSYRDDLATSVRHIEKVATKAASIADLPKILRGAREVMAQRPVAFNRLRAHMLSFASHVQGELSPLWTEVKRVKRFRKAEGMRPKTIQRRPLTVQEMDAVCAAYTDHQVKRHRWKGYKTLTAESLRAMTWTLATTGMRPAEYWQRNDAKWFDRGTYIQVDGTKTAAAKRPTFRLDTPIAPVCGEQFFGGSERRPRKRCGCAGCLFAAPDVRLVL